jgi:predicted RND superfamily exporter protein
MAEELKVTAINRRFVGFIARRPMLAILLGLGLVGALLPGLGKLRADFTHTGFFWSDDPKIKRFEAFERRFGNDDAVVLAVHSPSGVFDMQTAGLLRQLTDKMWQVPDIIRADSLSNFNWVHASGDDIVVEPFFPDQLTPEILAERKRIALQHPTLPKYLVSTDGRTALVFGRVKPGIEKPIAAGTITQALRKVVAEAKRSDETIHISGGPPLTYAFEEISQADLGRLIPLAILCAAFFLTVLLRNVAGTLLPFIVVFLSVASAFGFAGLAGRVQTAMSTPIPTILIAVGIADTVHILVTFLAELRRGRPRREAAHHALTKNFLATFLTGLTTAIGFFSFTGANLKPLSTMGVMAGVGTLMAWLLAHLVVGGLLFVLPIKAKPLPPERARNNERRAGALVDLIARRKRAIIAGTLVASALALIYAMGIDVNSDPIKYFRSGTPVRTASDFLEKEVGNARTMELVIDAGLEDGIKDPAFLAKVDAFSAWVEKQPRITRALSILDVLKQTHQSLHGDDPAFHKLAPNRETIAQELLLYTMGLPQGMDINDRVTVRNDAIRFTVFNTITTSRETVAMVKALEAKGKELGLRVEATGKYLLYQQMNEYVVQSFLTSIWSASLLIGLVMSFFLRSAWLGLISMIPNIVPLFAAGALLRFLGQPLDLGTVLVASICLGISIDDTSHVLANFAYWRRQGQTPNQAMKTVLSHTGPALLSTNGILITSFLTFASASFVPNMWFGLMTAFTLTVALATDMFFTPAILVRAVRGRASAPADAPSIAAVSS